MVRTQQGSVSAYILLVMGVLVTASIGVSGLAVGSLRRVRVDRTTVMAQQAAFAGLDHAIGRAWTNLESNDGKFVETEWSLTDETAHFTPGVVTTARVRPLADPKFAYITATSTYRNMTRSVRSFIAAKDVGIWNNSVFAGSGATGQAINGNVDMRGSLHILGEGEAYVDLNGNGKRDSAEAFTDNNGNGTWDPGEPFTDGNGDGVWNPAEPYNDTNSNGIYDPPLTQTDLNSDFSGSAQIGNNWYGMSATMEGLVSPIPTINGVKQLGAEVRVKHGVIAINGTANVGEATDPDGGTSKGKIDGSYVNDGYGGNQGATSVFSDNGTTNTYDLGNLPLKFPIISGIGAEPYKDKTGTTWNTHEQFLDNRSLTIPLTTISETTPAFSYGPDLYGNQIVFTPKQTVDGITYPARLQINGVVKVSGNLQLALPKEVIRYSGSGTLYATGDLNIDGHILPAPGLRFPSSTRMGFIAKRNMNLATGSGSAQLMLAGAFYAQGNIKSAKQNEVAGTFVANYYDMGTNVPKIFQVPNLVTNMPPGMPGDRRFFTLKVRSFRDRSPAPGQTDSTTGGTTGSTTGGTTGTELS